MANWFFLAVLAMIGYGIQNFMFKLAAKNDHNSIRVNTISMLTVAALSGILYAVSEPEVSGPYFIILVIANGLTYLFANICRIESFKLTPVKVALPIISIYVALTPILAFFIFRERISLLQLAGLTLASFTIVMLSREDAKKEERRKQIVLGILFAAVAAVSTSFNNIIGKSAAITGDITSFMFFSYVFSFIMALGMQKFINKDKNPLIHLINDYNATRIGVLIGIINFGVYYFMLKALVSGPAMLIFPIIGLGMVITMAISSWQETGNLTKKNIVAIGVSIVAVILLR